MADDSKYSFSIWRLEGTHSKTKWLTSRCSGPSAEAALKKDIAYNKNVEWTEGLYFVCDPGFNPDSGMYGPTLFWVTAEMQVKPIREMTGILVEQETKIDIETIVI